jgi:phosphinothricin acetyltransferase
MNHSPVNHSAMRHPTLSIEIRPVSPADIPAIHAIYCESVLNDTASWELVPPDLAEMRQRVETFLAKDFPYFVAIASNSNASNSDEVGGGANDPQIVGYSYASSYRERAGYRFTVEDSIYVKEGYQRLGIGAKLLAALIDVCTAKGYRQMVAVIGGSERNASISLHEKLGFARVGHLPNIGFKQGRWLDVVLMQRALGAGNATLPQG